MIVILEEVYEVNKTEYGRFSQRNDECYFLKMGLI